MNKAWHLVMSLGLAANLASCGDKAKLPEEAGYGSNPILPPAVRARTPTIKIAPAKGWLNGQTPVPADGFQVTAFAEGLDHPRWIYVLANGDVLVAETNAPPRKEIDRGLVQSLKNWIIKLVLSDVGAAVPSANRITLLRDTDRDGVAEIRTPFLTGLNSPFGMALIGEHLYVANTDAVLRFNYKTGDTRIDGEGVTIADLPANAPNLHWTKNLIASPDGQRLYVTVGSNSNAGENGIKLEEMRAGILEITLTTGQRRVFAHGLRNPNGLAWQPESGMLWTVVNERDGLGSDLVPDYMTSVVDGGFYGWPYSYFGGHIDPRVNPPEPNLVAKAINPDYALGAHTSCLGLAFYDKRTFPPKYWGGAFVGQHGSWNRNPISGYKVIFVPFKNGRPAGMPMDFLTGFVSDKGEALGRPVGTVVDADGNLLVADDVGNVIWRVARKN